MSKKEEEKLVVYKNVKIRHNNLNRMQDGYVKTQIGIP